MVSVHPSSHNTYSYALILLVASFFVVAFGVSDYVDSALGFFSYCIGFAFLANSLAFILIVGLFEYLDGAWDNRPTFYVKFVQPFVTMLLYCFMIFLVCVSLTILIH